jgi:outer membrane protein assembly factor BamB
MKEQVMRIAVVALCSCASAVPGGAPARPDLIVGISDRSTLVASTGWRFEHALDSRPVIAGEVVVGAGGGEVFALDARGELLWARPAVGPLRGADDDGQTTIVSIASLSGKRSTVLAVDREGVVVRQLELEGEVGAPALGAGRAYLPLDGRELVVVDLVDGSERARIDTEVRASRAFFVDGVLYVGEGAEAVRIDTLEEPVAGPRVQVSATDWPGDPWWLAPGWRAAPPWATRDDASRLLARPDASASVERWAIVAHRLVAGVHDQRLRWVRVGTSAVLDAAAGPSWVTVCDAAGRVRWLDLESGVVRREADLGQALVGCVVQTEKTPPAAAGPPPPLADQIGRALQARGSELLPAQLGLLGRLDDCAWLGRLADDAGVAEAIAAHARERLAQRACDAAETGTSSGP